MAIDWLVSLSCLGPGYLPSPQMPALEWAIYLLFSPCSLHILQAALNVFFISTFAVSSVLRLSFHWRQRPSPKYAKLGPSFIATLCLCSIASLLTSTSCAWHVWFTFSKDSALLAAAFSTVRALAWITYLVTLVVEIQRASIKHPQSIRAWWFLSSVLSVLEFSSATYRLVCYGLDYSRPLLVDDIVCICIFPISLFLLVISVRGPTGLSTYHENGFCAPLLNGEKGSHEKAKMQTNITGYYTAGLFSKTFWLWLNPLLNKGAKATLQISDVPELSPDDRAETLYAFFHSSWPRNQTCHPVRAALLRSFKGQLALTGCLVFTKAISMFVGPLLIQSFVYFLNSSPRYNREGYLLVSILLLGKFVEVLSTHQYQFLSQKLGMMIRSCLITTIYRKSLRLSSSSRQAYGAGTIVNYMTVDVQQINDSIVQLHNIWILPFQVVLAILIIYREVGVALLAGLLAMLLLVGIVAHNSRLLKRYSFRAMAKKDLRMRVTTEVLNYMRNIKLQAWEEYFRKRIEEARKAEYDCLAKFQYALASNISVLTMATSVVSVVTFGTCLLLHTELTAAKVFTVISTFNVLSEPIRTFPQAIISVSQAWISLERLDKYMLSKELENYVIRDLPTQFDYSIIVEDGQFSWDEGAAKPVLSNISLKIPYGRLVAIIGTVGAGKSSILEALLGEMPKLSGTVQVYGTTAYVPQTAWIQSGTVEENILFGLPMDHARYHKTLQACALGPDMDLFELGDQTEIGERGINLSGGQKQRVQLARAVYQDSDIYFLDDIFSAVDAHTGSAIFKDCILGILKNKTRVLVTHQVEFLRKVDLILVVQDGMILQAGSYFELLKAGAEFGALVAAHNKAIEAAEVHAEEEISELEEFIVGTPTKQWMEAFDESVMLFTRSSSGQLSNSQENVRKLKSTVSPPVVRERTKLVEEEKRESGRVGWDIYWLYLTKAYGPLFVFLVLVVQVILKAIALCGDFWLSYGTSNTSLERGYFMCIYLLLSAGNWFFVIIRAVLMAVFSLKATQKLYLDMLKSIFRAPMSFFDITPTGRILTRSSTDQATMDIFLPLSVMLALMLYSATIGVIIVTCMVTWPVLFVILPLGWVYIRYQIFYINSSREITRLDSITKAPVIHHFTETITGFMVIRGFGKEEDFIMTNLKHVNTNLKMDFHFNASNEWLGFRLELIGAVVLCVAAFLLVALPENVIQPGLAALALSYGLSLNTILSASVFFSCMIESKMVSVERISQFTKLPMEAPLVIKGSIPCIDWPDQGRISMQNLIVRYQPTMPLVIRGVSLDIEGGQKIGVVGRTGSGKSTLFQVLFRIVEPAGGKITFDEVDITSVGLHDLRSRLGIIPQDPVLFEGTIRTNMDPLSVHMDAEIWEGLRKCQLGEIVDARSDKLDAEVADNGENWSVGQRQLLCLGRALLKKSRILFLDEATASVDAQTDAVLQNIIREEFKTSTVVSIAHRIPTVMDCDKVMVLEAGLLKEYDHPAKLMENPSSLFAALVREYTSRSKG